MHAADILQIFVIELLVMTEAWKHHLKSNTKEEFNKLNDRFRKLVLEYGEQGRGFWEEI